MYIYIYIYIYIHIHIDRDIHTCIYIYICVCVVHTDVYTYIPEKKLFFNTPLKETYEWTGDSAASQYICSLYWAMTTVTTATWSLRKFTKNPNFG